MNPRAPFENVPELMLEGIRDHFRKHLDSLRADNDRTIEPSATEHLRGRIQEVKNILKLVEGTRPVPEFEDPNLIGDYS